MRILFVVTLLCIFYSSSAAQTDRGPPRASFVSGGAAISVPKQEFQASEKVRPLTAKNIENSFKNRTYLNAINELAKLDTTLALVVLEDDSIIHETYNAPAGPGTHQAGFSMSKSVVAYTLAFPYCEGKIADLSDRADKYASVLKGTVYGDSSIENLLTMRSGAIKPASHGLSRPTEPSDIWTGKATLTSFLKGYPERLTEAGVEFNYYNNNTQALVEVMNSTGGFENQLHANIIKKAGLESPAFWMKDKENNLYGGSGLMLTTRDWGRLALYFSDMLSGSINVCISKYMRAATSRQTGTADMVKDVGFKSYGYQTWIDPIFGSSKGFWLIGAGGQHIAIEPVTRKVLVLSSHGSLYGRVDYVIRAFTALVNR